ncbi:MAG: glycosyltransferase family 4 protein, partial [Elusimicrobiota bacterium]
MKGKRLKILIIANQFYPIRETGSAISASNIYNMLKKKHDVDLLIHDKDKYKPDYVRAGMGKRFLGHNISYLESNYDFEDGEYDIIHQYGGWKKSHLAKETKSFRDTKVVSTLNGPPPMCFRLEDYNAESSWCCKLPKNFSCVKKESINLPNVAKNYVYFKLNQYFMRYYDKLFAQSDWIKELFVKTGVPPEKVKVIGNFYDPSFYDSIKKLEFKKKKNSKEMKILYVGRLNKSKGVVDLVKAFNLLEKKEKVKLYLVGSGPLEKELSKTIEKMGLEEKIIMTGHVPYDEVIEYYAKSDIFVHPVKYAREAINRTLLEAGLSKNALVCSDVGTSPEVISDDGLIYKSG